MPCKGSVRRTNPFPLSEAALCLVVCVACGHNLSCCGEQSSESTEFRVFTNYYKDSLLLKDSLFISV